VQANGNRWVALYFVAFITVCSFCLLNLYIGVVFYQFSRIRLLARTGSVFLTEKQHQWSELAKMVVRLRPRRIPPIWPSRWRSQLLKICQHRVFEWSVMMVIVSSVAMMAASTYAQSQKRTAIMDKLNLVCHVA
jgi:hypothetical protein